MVYTDKIMRMSDNGYNGYKFKVESPKGSMTDQLKSEEGRFKCKFDVEIEHLDWLSIKESEDDQTFFKYRTGLGLFVVLTNRES